MKTTRRKRIKKINSAQYENIKTNKSDHKTS